MPRGLLAFPPEAVFEVRSQSDRWSELHSKVAEYLHVGVQAVCILDDDTKSVHVFYPDREPQVLSGEDEFALPNILAEFRVKALRFFE